jgi:hypothetical protein
MELNIVISESYSSGVLLIRSSATERQGSIENRISTNWSNAVLLWISKGISIHAGDAKACCSLLKIALANCNGL